MAICTARAAPGWGNRLDTVLGRGPYTWIYRAAPWYVTDPDAAREAETVQFQPPIVPG
jgi:hypothetical protein